MIKEGTTEKVLKFIMQLSQFTTKTLVSFNQKKCISEHYSEVQIRKSLLIGMFFVMIMFF